MSPQDLKQKAQTVSYAQLEKDPNSYQGTFAKFTGQILQIQQSGDTGIIRLSVTNEGYGIWSPSDVVYVEYNQATSAVDGDIVTIYGMLNGDTTYTSQANYQITLPDMVACGIGAIPSTTATSPAVVTPTPKAQSAPAVTTTQTSSSATPAPAAPSASLHPAFSYNGSTSIHTGTFTLQGSQQLITYTCSVADGTNPYSNFIGVIQSTTGYDEDEFAADVTCPTSNSTHEYSLSPGTYYLNLDSDNAAYTVNVEDYY